MMGMAKLSVKKGIIPQPPHAFPIFAAVVWGNVCFVFYVCSLFFLKVFACAGFLVLFQLIGEKNNVSMMFLFLGIVMWLFRKERDTLQGSLQASMQYLYNDSEVFSTFKNWLWHNR